MKCSDGFWIGEAPTCHPIIEIDESSSETVTGIMAIDEGTFTVTEIKESIFATTTVIVIVVSVIAAAVILIAIGFRILRPRYN